MSGPVLVIGATGETGSKVARGLRERGVCVRSASRSGAPGTARFDWYDPSTHADVLEGVRRLYLVAPVGEPEPIVRPFLEHAVSGGLERAVLLSSSAVEPGDRGLGALDQLVRDLVPEWAVLRPSWFMQNFTGDRPQAAGLRAGRVRSATGDGRVGFVDTSDIAEVAVELLTRADPVGADYVLTGPEALSYADVCALAGRLTGRTIVHEPVSVEDLAAHLAEAGLPDGFAHLLAGLDEAISRGAENRVTDVVREVTGHRPRSFAALLEASTGGPA